MPKDRERKAMADMRSVALIDLAHFELRMSPSGQLLHYAKGRIRTFWQRQKLILFGAATVGLLVSGPLGLVLALLAGAGEAADMAGLTFVIRRLEAGEARPWPRRIALISAGLQASTIAACVGLCWRGISLQEARFFAAAFLISAVINAGLGRPHLRPAADLRLAIFALTGFSMMALDLMRAELATSLDYGLFAAGFGVLAYISILFIDMVERNYLHRRRNEYALLKHQDAQERAQVDLTRSAHDSQSFVFVVKYAKDSIMHLCPGWSDRMGERRVFPHHRLCVRRGCGARSRRYPERSGN